LAAPKAGALPTALRPDIFSFALVARVAVPEKFYGKSQNFSTAAPAPLRFIRHWRRSAPLPKAGALPTALRPDIVK